MYLAKKFKPKKQNSFSQQQLRPLILAVKSNEFSDQTIVWKFQFMVLIHSRKKSSELSSSCFGCLQTLFLHDIPQFAKIGLSDDIIRFKLKSKEVVFFSLFQFTIQMENGSKIHQGSWVLVPKKKKKKREAEILGIFSIFLFRQPSST